MCRPNIGLNPPLCMALCPLQIQPIDMIKVRIQLSGEGTHSAETNPFRVLRKFIAEEGFFKLYRGLPAALLRQASYTTTRIGLFRVISNEFKRDDGTTPFYGRAISSLIGGGTAAIVGAPFDLALIRLQADQTLPVAERRGYTNVFNALRYVDGPKALGAFDIQSDL